MTKAKKIIFCIISFIWHRVIYSIWYWFVSYIQQILSVFTSIFCLIFILFHKWLIPKDNMVFGWVFVAFVIVNNLPYLSGIITSIVREKINEETSKQFIEIGKNQLRDNLKDDPDLINELADKTKNKIINDLKKSNYLQDINEKGKA